MRTIITTKLGTNRGKKRVWLEGRKLRNSGYSVGDKYNVSISPEDGTVSLDKTESGKYLVSKRNRNGELLPIIDLTLPELAQIFSGVEKLRVDICAEKIVICAHHSHKRQIERELALKEKLASGKPLKQASLFHGGGVMDSAISEGLEENGITTKLSLVNEIEKAYLEASMKNNSKLFDENTVILESAIEDIDAFELHNFNVEANILVGSTPCTGSSAAGKAKNKNKLAESHPKAGATFYGYLKLVELLNPAIIVLENIQSYQQTASMEVIRSTLSTLGYNLTEFDVNGHDFDVLENRNRFAMVAISKGLGSFDSESIKTIESSSKTIGDILEPIDESDSRFKELEYLRVKEERDLKSGKGFKRQLLTADSTSCPCITRQYHKYRSTDPMLEHSDGIKSRLFTPTEHARIKQVPQRIIDGLSNTISHEILGQGVIYPAFQAIGAAIGSAVKTIIQKAETVKPEMIKVAVSQDTKVSEVSSVNKQFAWVF